MQRRKFIAAIGSVAAGAAAVTGTGAFTSVTADRGLEVQVADDASALLAIDDIDNSPNSEYVDVSDNSVSIDISSDEGGVGLNNNATTKILDLLQIRNQGTQPVYVWASGMPMNPRVALAVQPNSQIQNDGKGAGQNQGALSLNSNLSGDDLDDDEGDGQEESAPELAPGDFINVELFATGDLSGLDFDDQITINAEDTDQVD